MPAMMLAILMPAAKPHHAWSVVEHKIFTYAERGTVAVSKFDGSHALLKAWLTRNRLTLELLGFPIDDAFPGKIAGGLVSFIGAAAVVLARSTGWLGV